MKTSMTILPILIALDWTKEFHMHINASNYDVGAMLDQNLNNTINHGECFFPNSWWKVLRKIIQLLEKKTLAMIYVVRKFNQMTFLGMHVENDLVLCLPKDTKKKFN
jgi:hypothetical protein